MPEIQIPLDFTPRWQAAFDHAVAEFEAAVDRAQDLGYGLPEAMKITEKIIRVLEDNRAFDRRHPLVESLRRARRSGRPSEVFAVLAEIKKSGQQAAA